MNISNYDKSSSTVFALRNEILAAADFFYGTFSWQLIQTHSQGSLISKQRQIHIAEVKGYNCNAIAAPLNRPWLTCLAVAQKHKMKFNLDDLEKKAVRKHAYHLHWHY